MASTANAPHGTCTLRCSVEKRSMCRDLQKWSKTLLCMIGLENVAERLVGRKKHQHRHGQHHSQPLHQHVLRVSPFIELSSSQANCGAESQLASTSEGSQAKASLPQDWDPKERCAICTQIVEKEELAKKAQAAAAATPSLPHSRSKKELRTNSDRVKEGADSKSSNRTGDNSASMATGSTAGSGSSSNKQSQLQHVIDWRSVNGAGGSSSSGHANVFGAMNMFRSASTGQSSSSSPFTTSGSLAAMFSPTGYPFFDLNQVYLNELLNHYSKVAAAAVAGGTSTSTYSMMSSLPMGVSSMPPPPLPYSVNAAFSFPHLVANLGSQGTQTTSSATTPSLTLDEPLDLSKKLSSKKCGSSGHCGSGTAAVTDAKTGSSAAASTTVAPSQSPLGSSGSKGPASNTSSNCSSASNTNKRTYSQADLQAAVDDIRSKKLGTRRASVVYGIPRSTLRNKIYKLEATDDDQSQSATLTGASGTCTQSARSSSRKGDKSKEASDSIIPSDDHKMEDGSLQPEHGALTADALCGRTTTSSEDSSASLSSSASSSSSANESNPFSYVDSYNGGWTTAAAGLTAELAKRQAVEALWRSSTANGASRSAFNEITSFSSPIVNGSAAVKNVLQEAVCCALTENLKLKCGSSGAADSVPSPVSLVSKALKTSSSGKRSSSSRRRGSASKASASAADRSPATMVKIDRPAQSVSTGGASSNAEDANDPSKKIRPKRGQYRKYDKNALAEAVHAVRRGEMSVHRAGSFYGVPHSTLEYKVKERNLLRPKKRDLKKKPDDAGNGETSTAPVHVPEEASTPVKAPESTSSEKSPSSTTPTKPKSSRSTKSKRSKRPSQAASSPAQTTSPLPDDIFSSLFPLATTSTDLDTSATTTEPSPKKKRKSGAVNTSMSSSPSSSPRALSNLIVSTPPEATEEKMNAEEPQASAENDVANEKGEYSTLKAYEAGFQAALLASDILHRLQMQTYSATNENTSAEPEDGDKTSQAQQASTQLTAKSE